MPSDSQYAAEIAEVMALSAANRGTGIARRTPGYIKDKINNNLAVIALDPFNGEWVGFSCLEVWQHEKYVAGSGLIVSQKYRGNGASQAIKFKLFELCRQNYPAARLYSITASPVVAAINNKLGYKLIPKELVLADKLFLDGNNSWVDFISLLKHDPRYVVMAYENNSADINRLSEAEIPHQKALQEV